MAEPYYITTAIHYPNGRPHIGHAYEMIAADAVARFQRQAGRDVRFQTGTDEHGLKMVQTARAAGADTRAFADEMSSYFSDMADRLEISYDRFIRTVEPAHYTASQAIWQAMADAGDLYLDRYEGWYSVRDEAFYEEKELTGGEGTEKLSPQGTPVEWTAEETWFFRLSNYQQPLLDHYAANPDFIRPESRRNEILRFVEGGLTDLSVSRTSFDWGVPVPGSDGHVMYVWVDALTNYLTGAGYPGDAGDMARFWPADLHLIGKDIVRFHAVYWPAFLMSAQLALPRQIFGHGFLLHRGEKMSKSIGNVVDPLALADAFGVDALRYFLLRDISFGQDGSYSAEAIVTRVNAELANSFGNLAQRTLAFIAKNLDGAMPDTGRADDADGLLIEEVVVACAALKAAFGDLLLSQGIEAWMRGVFACNQYIDAQAPWALRKTDPARMHAVLRTLVRAIRMLGIAILPVVPAGAGKVLDQLGATARDHDAIDDDGWYDRHAASGFRIARRARSSRGSRCLWGVMFADSHCHLNYEGLAEDQPAILARARTRGVTAMLNIATREREWDAVQATAEREPDVWASVGIHPHEADDHPHVDTATLVARARHPRIVGIGESGLDYHYDHSDRDRQRASFRAHIAACRETGLPLIVHTRDAEADTLAILADEMGKGAYRGVIHCFTASGAFADQALALGFYISISGIVTFRNARDLQQTAARLPLDRLLIETDAPFLAPVPHRGKTGEPAFVADTAAFLAALRGEDPATLAAATRANFFTLFAKAAA